MTNNSRHVDANPDYHLCGTTDCRLRDGDPRRYVDLMDTIVFWEWHDWAGWPNPRGWRMGGLYEWGGCGTCYGGGGHVIYGTQGNDDVPHADRGRDPRYEAVEVIG